MKTLKNIASLLLLSHCLQIYGQRGEFLIRANPNFDIYKPYTHLVPVNSSIKSRTYTCAAQYVSYHSKVNWAIGLSYKRIYHYVDKFYKDDYTYYDLKSTSNSSGLISELSRTFQVDKVKRQMLGISSEIYLAEIYRSIGINRKSGYEDQNVNQLIGRSKGCFLSSLNAAVFYRITIGVEEKARYSFKISLGTNVYSDWDQFSRYAWIGLGLEVGFVKKQRSNESKTP